MSVDAMVKQIEGLPQDEREQLLDRLFEQYGELEESIQLSDDVKQLLDERVAAYEADPTDLRSWDQVMESVRRQK